MNFISNAQARIKQGNEILHELSSIRVDGVSKLKNKIKQEINFLQKCLNNCSLEEKHLVCSNLTHLEALASKLIKLQNVCTSVMSNKTLYFENGYSRKICVDLMLNGGFTWMKVIARNQKSITLVSNGTKNCQKWYHENGEGSFGQKSILDQAREFLKCSQQNVHYFKHPTVIFSFANGVEECVARDLRKIGVKVENCQVNQHNNNFNLTENIESISDYPIKDLDIIRNLEVIKRLPCIKLNLGVTTLIAYVSALTNGGCHYNFNSEILKKHAEWEKARPVKPILDELFKGRELYCCSTAVNNFKSILNILGGESERERGEKLLSKIIVVEDRPTNKLKVNGKVKERSLAIFGTGEFLQAVTVTANHAFVRSAMNQGIYFPVFLHESRALTEGKQLPF